MAGFLLDTNHVSEAIRPVSRVRERIEQSRRAGVRVGTCVPVLCELEAALQTSVRRAAHRRTLDRLLQQEQGVQVDSGSLLLWIPRDLSLDWSPNCAAVDRAQLSVPYGQSRRNEKWIASDSVSGALTNQGQTPRTKPPIHRRAIGIFGGNRCQFGENRCYPRSECPPQSSGTQRLSAINNQSGGSVPCHHQTRALLISW